MFFCLGDGGGVFIDVLVVLGCVFFFSLWGEEKYQKGFILLFFLGVICFFGDFFDVSSFKWFLVFRRYFLGVSMVDLWLFHEVSVGFGGAFLLLV